MIDFDYWSPTYIAFGKGKESRTGELPLTFAELGAKEADIPLLVKTLNLNGNTLGGFQPLAESDVAAIYRLCLAQG